MLKLDWIGVKITLGHSVPEEIAEGFRDELHRQFQQLLGSMFTVPRGKFDEIDLPPCDHYEMGTHGEVPVDEDWDSEEDMFVRHREMAHEAVDRLFDNMNEMLEDPEFREKLLREDDAGVADGEDDDPGYDVDDLMDMLQNVDLEDL